MKKMFLALIGSVFIVVFFISPRASAEYVEVGYQTSHIFGGTGQEYTQSIEFDSTGASYTLGIFQSTVDFDPTSGTDNRTSNGNYDIFLTKLNSDGSYVYTYTFGGTGWDNGYKITIDEDDNVYITSAFIGTVDFDPTSGTDMKVSAGGSYDAALTKLNSDSSYAYTRVFSGTGTDYAYASVVDSSGKIFVTGRFTGTVDFDPTSGVDSKSSNGSSDGYVVALNPDGSYDYSHTFGGAFADRSYNVALGPADQLFVTGYFSGTVDFDPTSGVDNRTSNGNNDTFIMKLSPDGYVASVIIGGTGSDIPYGLSVTEQGHVYITGTFQGTVDFDPTTGSDLKTSNGSNDIFLLELDTSLQYVRSHTFGGTGSEDNTNLDVISVDNYGAVYITGTFQGTVDFDPTTDTNLRSSAGLKDVFMTRFSAKGSYSYTLVTGGNGDEDLGGIEVSDNSILYSGSFSGTTDINPFPETDSRVSSGGLDVFLAKLTQSTYNQINGLTPSLIAKTPIGLDATNNTIIAGTSTTIRLSLTDSTPIADVDTSFDADLDWSNVAADSDMISGKTFVHNLTAADGTSGTYTLYVPKLFGHNSVGICPGVNSLTSTTTTCLGLYYLTQGVNGNLSTANIDGKDYWVVSGLTGTGGFSAVAAANTTTGIDTNTLANTGQDVGFLILAAGLVIAIGGILYRLEYHKRNFRRNPR